MRKIYLDHNATTFVHPEVFDEMKPYFTENFGNASSIHEFGRIAKAALEDSRQKIAGFFGCKPKGIIFTSGEQNRIIWQLKVQLSRCIKKASI
jgi:cysteine desulfurase